MNNENKKLITMTDMNKDLSSFIKARVIATGQIIEVDDCPIWFGFFKCYNMWHNDRDGKVYHDDELVFVDKRLQQ